MIFQPLREIAWLDQILHVTIGATIASILTLIAPWYVGLLAVLMFAGIREWYQHPWSCGPGCRTDLAAWSLGALLGNGLMVLGQVL